jgi:magnesium-transporting ATPase (P-type)
VNLHQKSTEHEAVRFAHPAAPDEDALIRKLAAAHCQPAQAVVAALGSDLARGLSRTEARMRLERHGPNRLKSAPETPWWRRLLEQFQNFLVIILLVATVISMVE